MGMTIDDAIKRIDNIMFTKFTTVKDEDAFLIAIETMRKYQKIKEVMDDYFHNDRALMSAVIKDIERTIENGIDD